MRNQNYRKETLNNIVCSCNHCHEHSHSSCDSCNGSYCNGGYCNGGNYNNHRHHSTLMYDTGPINVGAKLPIDFVTSAVSNSAIFPITTNSIGLVPNTDYFISYSMTASTAVGTDFVAAILTLAGTPVPNTRISANLNVANESGSLSATCIIRTPLTPNPVQLQLRSDAAPGVMTTFENVKITIFKLC